VVYILEQVQIHVFLILFSLLDTFMVWKHQMSVFTVSISAEEENDIPLWGMKTMIVELPVNKVAEYEKSMVDENQLKFFEEISSSLEDIDCILPDLSPAYDGSDELITMDVWKEETAPVKITKKLSASASSRINDFELGEQLWVVEVVGEEQGYLHISDGSARTWIDGSNFGSFSKGDILSVLVERKSDNRITTLDIDILQKRSTDFLIPDEIWLEENEEEKVYTA